MRKNLDMTYTLVLPNTTPFDSLVKSLFQRPVSTSVSLINESEIFDVTINELVSNAYFFKQAKKLRKEIVSKPKKFINLSKKYKSS